jgi:hypothetical protein
LTLAPEAIEATDGWVTNRETWPFEGILAAVERGTLPDWRRLATAIRADPWGPVAHQVLEAVSLSRPYGTTELLEGVVARARKLAAESEREDVASEVRTLVAGSGLSRRDFAERHQVSMAGLPDRYIAGLTVDPTNPAHAYAIFNGYSRRFVPGGGVGHVFETTDGGQTWTDISGNLPDIASDALVLSHGQLALGTDAGVYTAAEGQGSATTWSRLGTGLPNVVIDDLTDGHDGYIYAATHGRGVWRIAF